VHLEGIGAVFQVVGDADAGAGVSLASYGTKPAFTSRQGRGEDEASRFDAYNQATAMSRSAWRRHPARCGSGGIAEKGVMCKEDAGLGKSDLPD